MSICPRVPGWVRGQSLFGQCPNVLPNIWNGQYRGAAAVPLFHFFTVVLSQMLHSSGTVVQDLLYTVVHPLIPSSSLSSSLCFSLYLCLRFNHQSAILCPSLVPLFWNAPQQTELQCELNRRQCIPMYSRNHSAALNWSPKVFFFNFSPSSKWVWSARSMFLLNSVAKKCARRSKNGRGGASRSWKAAPLCPNSCTPVDTLHCTGDHCTVKHCGAHWRLLHHTLAIHLRTLNYTTYIFLQCIAFDRECKLYFLYCNIVFHRTIVHCNIAIYCHSFALQQSVETMTLQGLYNIKLTLNKIYLLTVKHDSIPQQSFELTRTAGVVRWIGHSTHSQ